MSEMKVPRRTKKAMRGAIWPSCVRTGKPWTCAPMRWHSAAAIQRAQAVGRLQPPGSDAIQVMTMKVSEGLEFLFAFFEPPC